MLVLFIFYMYKILQNMLGAKYYEIFVCENLKSMSTQKNFFDVLSSLSHSWLKNLGHALRRADLNF